MLSDIGIITKYVVRVCHIGSMIAISYKVINDYLSGSISPDIHHFYQIMGFIVALSGFVNTYLLQPQKMGQNRKLWISYHHFKLLISIILFAPIYKMLPIKDITHNLRFYWLLSIIIVSPFMRFYRQFYTQKLSKKQAQID